MLLNTDVTHVRNRWGRRRSARTPAGLVTAALVASGLAVVVAPQAAVAAPALSCINTIYLTSSTDQSVRSLNLTSGAVSTTPVFTIPTGVGASANQIGVAADGLDAYYGTATSVVDYNAAAGTTTSSPKPAGVTNGTVGAVNPKTGLYYYGAYSGATLQLYVYDPATGVAAPGPVATVNVTDPPGGNGDIAFDKAGRLYLVNSSATLYRLYVVDGVVPTSGTGAVMSSVELTNGPATAAANGIAFASDGYLYLGAATTVQRANPITGAPTGPMINLTGASSTDLATCANPSTTEVVTTFPNGKDQPTDSTTVVVDGGSYGAPGTGPDFPASTVQPDGTTATEPGIVLPGETYTVRQTGNGTTDLSQYDTTWECRDTEGNVIASGEGNTATYTVPTGTDGASIVCTFANVLPLPVAVPDEGQITFGTPSVTLAGAVNDTPGNSAIDPSLTVFTSAAATNGGKTLITPEGTWTIGTDGQITFTPAAGYAGTTAPVEYQITDADGLTSTSTATVTVRPGPAAVADTQQTTQGIPVAVSPLTGDTASQNADGTAGSIPTASLLFPAAGQPAGAVITGGGRTLTVDGEGVYVINPANGAVTFTPEPAFFGVAQPVAYTFTDSMGNTAGSTITITVTEVAPTAAPDSANTPFATEVTVDVLDNDIAGPGGPIDAGATILTSPGATNGGKTLVTPEGTWTVNADGTITFVPADGYSGTTPGVTYQLTNEAGQTATSTVTVTVRPGPVAAADTDTTGQNVDVSFTILGNDTPGLRADGSLGTFDMDSVRFVTTGLPAGSTVSGDGYELTVPGEGEYTFDPATGEVTFNPEAQFTGIATPVTYEVDDEAGNTASTTITITVTAITPVVVADAVKTPGDTPIEFDPLDNDDPGAETAPLDPSTVIFTSPAAADGGKSLVTPQGEWTIREDGTIRFEPAPGFEGVAGPIEYEVRDDNGTPARGTVTVTVGSGAVAGPDSGTTKQGQPVTVGVLTNDAPSDLGNPCEPGETNVPAGCDTGVFVPGSVVFPTDGQPEGAVVSNAGRTLTVAGEGVYTIDAATGVVTFAPEAAFSGTVTPVIYTAVDSHDVTVASTVTIVVTAVTPFAVDDTATTVFETPVTLELLANDTAGDEVVPLVPSLTVFPSAGQPAGVTVSEDGKTLTIAGQGTFVLNGDGDAVFTPDAGWSGATTPVNYRIEDENGTQREAAIRVTVRPGPTALADTASTSQGIAVTVSPLGNDTPSRNLDDSVGEWDAASVVFPVDGQPEGASVSEGGKTLTVPGQGVYTIDEETGAITFAPEPSFRGAATPVVYAVTDQLDNTTTATVTITVQGLDPVAKNDTITAAPGSPVTIDVLANDSGATGAPLNPASLQLVSTNGALVDRIVVPGEGTWTIVDGKIVFTPLPDFRGTTTPVTYSIADVNGVRTTATVTVTVTGGLPATGGDIPWLPIGGGLALLLGGLVLLIRRRRTA